MPITFAAFSQNGVALVLSGGGAKGVTHIGVIRALEDYGIPIDYIAGTSMGAIIGGLYASGYSPDEMEDIIKSDDFKNWVSGRIPNKYKFYYKEDIPNASWLNFKVNYDSILATNILPTNIISPEQMDFAFMEIFSRANAVAGEDFDNLMIPFRCVASDVAGNKAVILKDGNLGAAVRASMTFPFYFKPIRIDSTLLFDGGMYNNFPVDVVIEDFNPDLIIGCKAAGNYGPPDEDNLISQLQTMLMEKTNYVVPEDKGVLIEPHLKKTNVVDFKNTDAFIDSGYVAAVRSIPEIISRLDAVKDPSYFSLRRFRFNDVQPDFIIKNFDIKGLSKPQENYIRKLLSHQSDSIFISDFRFEYFKLLAEHQFDRLYPLASYNEDTQAFDIKLEVDRQRSIDVQFGGLLSSNPVNEANIGLTYHHLGKIALRFGANTYVGRFYSSARLWGRADFPERKPYYLLASINFSQKDYFETSTYFFEDKNLSYLIQNENYMDIILGFPTRHRGKFEIGICSGNTRDDYYQQNNFSRSDTADLTYFDMINAGLKYEINSLNRKQFASKGVRLLLSLKYQWGLENYEPGSTSFSNSLLEKEHDYLHLNIVYENFFISNASFQIGFYSQLMMSTRKAFSNYVSSVLSAPAFSPVPESRSLFMPEFRAFNFGALGIRTVIPVRPNVDWRIEAYGFQPYQELKKADNGDLEFGKFFSDRYYMGSSSLIFHSPLGPVSLVFNYFDRAEDEFSFNVNFGYYIFNPSLKD